MSIGSWDDFTSKYGFGDGNNIEDRDFKARDNLVRLLNRSEEVNKASVRAIPYDRPGVHNPCLVLVVKDVRGVTNEKLSELYFAGKIKTGDMPLAEYHIQEMIGEAYAQADKIVILDELVKTSHKRAKKISRRKQRTRR